MNIGKKTIIACVLGIIFAILFLNSEESEVNLNTESKNEIKDLGYNKPIAIDMEALALKIKEIKRTAEEKGPTADYPSNARSENSIGTLLNQNISSWRLFTEEEKTLTSEVMNRVGPEFHEEIIHCMNTGGYANHIYAGHGPMRRIVDSNKSITKTVFDGLSRCNRKIGVSR
jgi:hypothetical protein